MTIFLVDLESVETRYTGQWKTHVPKLLKKAGHNVQIISGPTDIPSATTPGAFLNFGGTNIYKSAQVEQMGRLFCSGAVKPGDHFLFTDAWHPGIINLKYMSELLQIPVTIHALSTNFHIRLFADTFKEGTWSDWIDNNIESGKIVRTGWPMEYMDSTLTSYKNMPKRDVILFPHRIAPEKQVEIFRDLKEHLPQYEFIVCQDQQLTKNEYHNLLGESKLVFSANLQETLSISWYEGALVDAIPMMPDRLSYSEMAYDTFKYPSEWTESWDQYLIHRQEICHKIIQYMDNYEKFLPQLKKQTRDLHEQFFSAKELVRQFS